MKTKLSVLLVAGVLALPSSSHAQSLAGLWDATIVINHGIVVPFRFEIDGAGRAVRGAFFNGDEKVGSSAGRFENGSLELPFDTYGATLQATLQDGELDGQYARASGAPFPFHAKRFTPSPADAAGVPSIAGLWNVQVKSSKGENAWRFIVRQSGPEVSAAILRVDGDTGLLTGTYHDGAFVLSHFDGARPLRLEVKPAADGTLTVAENGGEPHVAVRMEEARAKGLPEPADPSQFTSVKDPTEPLRFSFPDLSGRIVSNTDPQFQGKVVIVSISGSWCPNCHDEAPFLVDLYRKYHGRGLEIVSLSFEEGAQLKDPVRLRAFIKHYGIKYTVLLAGEPREAGAKLPQAVNMNSFPTTFFIGRDGRVRGVHAGFAGAATGSFHDEMIKEITNKVQGLLAEAVQTSASR